LINIQLIYFAYFVIHPTGFRLIIISYFYYLFLYFILFQKYDIFDARIEIQDLIQVQQIHGRSPKQLDLEVVL
jgi:hypothetical protein